MIFNIDFLFSFFCNVAYCDTSPVDAVLHPAVENGSASYVEAYLFYILLTKSHTMIYYVISWILEILIIVVPLLVSVAYFTLAERKVLASMQRRRGPNIVGMWGLLQPLADGLKLLVKESILPSNANLIIFVLAPILTFLLSLLGWAVIPFGSHTVLSYLNIGLLYIFAVSSLGVYGIIMSGWARILNMLF